MNTEQGTQLRQSSSDNRRQEKRLTTSRVSRSGSFVSRADQRTGKSGLKDTTQYRRSACNTTQRLLHKHSSNIAMAPRMLRFLTSTVSTLIPGLLMKHPSIMCQAVCLSAHIPAHLGPLSPVHL